MFNYSLLKNWENWVIIFLMISIFLVGMHIFVAKFGTDKDS